MWKITTNEQIIPCFIRNEQQFKKKKKILSILCTQTGWLVTEVQPTGYLLPLHDSYSHQCRHLPRTCPRSLQRSSANTVYFNKGEDMGVRWGLGSRAWTTSSTVMGDAWIFQSVSQQDNCHKGGGSTQFIKPTIPKATCFFIKEQKLWKFICMTLRIKNYFSCLNIKILSWQILWDFTPKHKYFSYLKLDTSEIWSRFRIKCAFY